MELRFLAATNFKKYLAKKKLLGKYARQTRIESKTISHATFMKNKWSSPIVFLGLLWTRTKYSVKAKKFFIYLKAFPMIFFGIIFWEG